jgi:hypothetical protein
VIKEVDRRKRMWRNCDVLMNGKNRSTRVKILRKNNVFKIILFSTPYIKNEIQTAENLPPLFILTGTRFSHLHGHSKICTDTDHRLVCWICGAGLMARSKSAFY